MREQLLSAYREMFRARKTDEKCIVLYKQNKCHFQIGCAGHEAIQVATVQAMQPAHDWAYPYYRDMAFVGAWGMSTREMLLNAMNKADDPNSGGRQMPMHYGHKDLRIVSQSSPTGTQYLQAVGAAIGVRYRNEDEVIYVSSGEGTTAQGAYHEALNWAARERLPVVFLIQDNKFAISVHVSEHIAGKSVAAISSGYEGLEVLEVNGLDYFQSLEVMTHAVNRARSGDGPSVVVADVVRLQSHSISDNQLKYRHVEEIEEEKKQDPIRLFAEALIEKKVVTQQELDAINSEIIKQIDADAEWAELQADPEPGSAMTHVYIEQHPVPGLVEKTPDGPEEFMVDAINHALHEEMAREPLMMVYGQDVAYGKGGVFSVTVGLTDAFGVKRCFNSPLAEDSILGSAVGLATVGFKPVVEIQFGDYIWTAMMQIRNELAAMLYRSAGDFSCPLVVRVAVGGYIHGALYHSQNIEATFGHYPGLIVLYPSNAADAKGLLKSAIRAKDPVLFLEHKGLYRQVYAKSKVGDVDDLIPIGKARIVRPGTHATIVTWGALVQKSLLAAQALAQEGMEVEIIDIRSILPLDSEAILESVKRTGRVLVAHEDVEFMGFGAEIAAQIAEHAFGNLDAPIMRLGGKFTMVPHAPGLESEVLPQNNDVLAALRRLIEY